MYYLKYRPQKVAEIDAELVRVRLEKILSHKSLPHAFLFAGPKGTGKTSAARILAKAVNCEKNTFAKRGKSFEPCNRCSSCKSITTGTAADILEMDAASHRKIDDIRDLISKISFAPVTARYKVYIIDEVHMLTKEAFNALLKTLEEPPANTVFVLATTEPEALPKTIISRCLNIQFKRATHKEIVHMLRRISRKEKLKVPKETLNYIAQYADYSFRDGAKILEEAVVQKTLSIDGVNSIIGLAVNETDLLHHIDQHKLQASLDWIRDAAHNGADFGVLTKRLLEILHQLLLTKNEIEVKVLGEYNFTEKEILRLMKLFQEAYRQLKYTPIEQLPLEIAVAEFISIRQN